MTKHADWFVQIRNEINTVTIVEVLSSILATIVLLFAGASLYLWYRAWIDRVAGKPLFPQVGVDSRLYHPLAVMLIIPWLLLTAVSQFQAQGAQVEINPEAVVQMILLHGLMVVTLLLITFYVAFPRRASYQQLGMRTNDLFQQVKDGGRGFLLALTPVIIVLAITFPLRSEDTTHAVLKSLIDNPDPQLAILLVVLAVITAPLFEELVFRVILQDWIIRLAGVKTGIVVTALVFAGIHQFPDSLPLIPLALLLGYVYERRRSFLTVFLIHAFFNGFNVVMVVIASLATENVPL